MTFGYLLVVSTHDSIDYVKMAYALALSIKNTQKPGYDNVALVIDDVSVLDSIKSKWVFNTIIEWNQETFWDGRSWMDRLTPWDYTVCLDVDMLFFNDISHQIDYFIDNDIELFLPSTVYTYRGTEITADFYRKTFTANQLPNIYSLFTFFKKESRLAHDFFTLGRHIIKNPVEFKNCFLANYTPVVVGTDEAFALSAKILNIQDTITYRLSFPHIVHLKPMIQDWPWPATDTFNHVGFYFDVHGQLKIGNFQQLYIIHYVDKTILTDEYISILENIAWKITHD